MHTDARANILEDMRSAKRELQFLSNSVSGAEPGPRLVATLEQIQQLRLRTQVMVQEFLALTDENSEENPG